MLGNITVRIIEVNYNFLVYSDCIKLTDETFQVNVESKNL